MRKQILAAALALSGAVQADLQGDHSAHHMHLSQAPAGVTGDHVHRAGDWMLSYSYRYVHMDGMRDGSDRLSDGEVLADFMVAPLRMDMEMHMLGAMYAMSDRLTLMAMLPWVSKAMDHVTRMGARFTTRSQGLGDVRLSGLYALSEGQRRNIVFSLGISAPSGDIDESDDTPAMNDAQLPYPMQLGSGTWDLLPGVTWTGRQAAWSWGAQLLATVRLGDNDNDYSLGDRLELGGWASYRLAPAWSMSLRLAGQAWGDVDGEDPQLNPGLVPTADPELQGGQRLDLLAGVNFYVPPGFFASSRLALEAGLPAYEHLDGPQMSADWLLSASLQLQF